jgi:hypothetical protein
MPRPYEIDVLIHRSDPCGARNAGARPIGHARVCRAIGQVACRLASAEAEIFRRGVAHGPAAVPLLQLEERAAVRARLRHFFEARLRCPHRTQRSVRSRNPGARAVGNASLAGGCVFEARQPEPVCLANDCVSADPDLAGDLRAGKSGRDPVLQECDALRRPRCMCFDCRHGLDLRASRASLVRTPGPRGFRQLPADHRRRRFHDSIRQARVIMVL